MKELSIEEKAKAYEELIERLKDLKFAYRFSPLSDTIEEIFPELKESEDEMIQKELLAVINDLVLPDEQQSRFITWIEKQDEHKKFRDSIQVGDKVTRNQDGMLVNLSQLKRIAKPNETKQDEQKPAEWDILSAKKGDMLSNGTIVLIVDSIEEFEGRPIINSWYFADSEKFYGKGTSECDRWEVGGFRTATKIECNYLLKMIADAEYEWDADKKELKKIEQKPWSEKEIEL